MFRKKSCAVATAVLLALCLAGTGLAEEVAAVDSTDAGLSVGMAKVDMTLDPSARTIRLAGYSGRGRKPANAVLDPVFARALVASDDEGHVFGLVSADLCYINSELRGEVLARLRPYGFDENNLMMAATHTHSSFAGYDKSFLGRKLFGEFDSGILDHLASSIAKAVLKANGSMQPAVLEIATERLEGMNRNRRAPVFDMTTGKADRSMQPNRQKYPTDERMTVIRITRTDGSPVGAIIHFTAHPTVLSPKNLAISADYVGVLCGRVEDALGGGAVVLFLNGTLGDVAPLPDWSDDVATEIAQLREYGDELADAALQILPNVVPMSGGDLVFNTANSDLPRVVIRPLARWKLPRAMYGLFYQGTSAPFQAVRLGDVVLLAIPGEPTTEFGMELEGLCPAGYRCIVVGLANGSIGYLVTPQQYREGGYEANVSFFGLNVIDWVKSSVKKALAGLP